MTDPVGEAQMDIDQLFAELRRASNDSERQMLVNNALRAGVDLEQLREMLDYVEACGSKYCCTRKDLGSKSPKFANHQKWSWAAFFSH